MDLPPKVNERALFKIYLFTNTGVLTDYDIVLCHEAVTDNLSS